MNNSAVLETIFKTNAVNSQSYFMQAYHILNKWSLKKKENFKSFWEDLYFLHLPPPPQPKNKWLKPLGTPCASLLLKLKYLLIHWFQSTSFNY
jgi:hypothetical protein